MAFADPKQIVRQFAVGEGWHVADFGTGSGAYALALVEKVGHEGRVYAVDIQKDLLVRVKNEAKTRGFLNLEIVWGNIEEAGGSKLRDNSMDAVIASNILFQLENKKGCVREVSRVLKQNGRALVVDWTDSFGGLGPRQNMVIPENETKELFQKEGFIYEQSIPAGDHHYGIIFKKK